MGNRPVETVYNNLVLKRSSVTVEKQKHTPHPHPGFLLRMLFWSLLEPSAFQRMLFECIFFS